MKKNYSFLKKMAVAITTAILFCNPRINAQVTQTFTYTGALQTFTVPACVSTVTMEAYGAQGGSLPGYAGGLGAYMSGVFTVTTGQVLSILVAGQGVDLTTTATAATGGGGGSFIATISNTVSPTPLLVAGGGSGRRNTAGSATNASGTISVNGQPCIATPGTAGTGGNGGTSNEPTGMGTGGPGGGFYTNGGPCGSPYGAQPGNSFISGGAIALVCSPFSLGGSASNGGFGGGGAGCYCYRGTPGGGGGFSGGGTGMNENCSGGGGSYNSGTSQVNTSGVRSGNGLVTITYNFNGAGLTASASSPSIICTGSSASLTASGVLSYTWSPGGSNSASISVSPTVATVYTVQGTNSLGCISNAQLTVNVNTALPSLTIASTATAVCSGKGVTYTASGANTYTWTTGSFTTPAVSYTPALPGASYTVSGQNACGISTASVSVVTNTIPAVTASINNPTVCSGGSVTLNGGGAVTYTWSAGYPNNTPFTPASTTNYTVTGTAANACTATAVTGVTVFITPNVAPVASPTAICVGASSTLSAVGATSYSWSPGVNLVTASISVSPSVPTTYTLYRSNGACTSTTTINLVVNALPIISATGSPSQICAGQGVNLVVVGPITNTWYPGVFPQSNFTVFPNASTNYTVIGSNANCTISAVVNVSVNPSPALNISFSTPTVCSGGLMSITAGGALTYTWLPVGLGNNPSISVNPTSNTQYTVTGSNAFGCTATQNPLAIAYPLPNTNITASSAFICANSTAVLGVPNTPGIIYQWSNGANTPSITVNPPITTGYTLTGTDPSTGCQSTGSTLLSVYIATFAVSSPTALCKGNTATLTALGAASSYSWGAAGSGSMITVSPQASTIYYVTGTTGNCQSTQSVSLIVNPVPNVKAVPSKNPACYLDFSLITASGADSYVWNDGETTAAIGVTVNFTTTYTVTGTDLNGCSKTVTVTQYLATCAGIENYSGNTLQMDVYPNPNNGSFIISTDVAMNLIIVNTLGQEVSRLWVTEGSQHPVQLNNLPNGIYFITGQANGLKVNKKIVVER